MTKDNAVVFVRYPQLREMGVPFTYIHLVRLEKAGRFPQRVYLAKNTRAWLANEVKDWIAARANKRVPA